MLSANNKTMTTKKNGTKDDAIAVPQSNMPMAFHPDNASGLIELIQENLGGSTISISDLQRVKIPAGGITQFQVPNLETGENDMVKSIEGVIIGHKLARAFWIAKYGTGDGGNHPPDCSSNDMIHGYGNPNYVVGDGSGIEQDGNGAWLCETCPNNRYGSAVGADGQPAAGKLVKDSRFIFFLAKDSLLPQLIIAPAMSLKPSQKYFFGLTARNKKFNHVITKFTLKEFVNKANIKYSQLEMTMSEELEPQVKAQSDAFAKTFAPLLGTAVNKIQAEIIDDFDDNDYSNQPL